MLQTHSQPHNLAEPNLKKHGQVNHNLTDLAEPNLKKHGQVNHNLTYAGRIGATLEAIDWKKLFDVTATGVAMVALGWAITKTIGLIVAVSAIYAAAMVGMHLPLCLFSTLFAALLLREHETLGILAVVSSVINSLAI